MNKKKLLLIANTAALSIPLLAASCKKTNNKSFSNSDDGFKALDEEVKKSTQILIESSADDKYSKETVFYRNVINSFTSSVDKKVKNLEYILDKINQAEILHEILSKIKQESKENVNDLIDIALMKSKETLKTLNQSSKMHKFLLEDLIKKVEEVANYDGGKTISLFINWLDQYAFIPWYNDALTINEEKKQRFYYNKTLKLLEYKLTLLSHELENIEYDSFTEEFKLINIAIKNIAKLTSNKDIEKEDFIKEFEQSFLIMNNLMLHKDYIAIKNNYMLIKVSDKMGELLEIVANDSTIKNVFDNKKEKLESSKKIVLSNPKDVNKLKLDYAFDNIKKLNYEVNFKRVAKNLLESIRTSIKQTYSSIFEEGLTEKFEQKFNESIDVITNSNELSSETLENLENYTKNIEKLTSINESIYRKFAHDLKTLDIFLKVLNLTAHNYVERFSLEAKNEDFLELNNTFSDNLDEIVKLSVALNTLEVYSASINENSLTVTDNEVREAYKELKKKVDELKNADSLARKEEVIKQSQDIIVELVNPISEDLVFERTNKSIKWLETILENKGNIDEEKIERVKANYICKTVLNANKKLNSAADISKFYDEVKEVKNVVPIIEKYWETHILYKLLKQYNVDISTLIDDNTENLKKELIDDLLVICPDTLETFKDETKTYVRDLEQLAEKVKSEYKKELFLPNEIRNYIHTQNKLKDAVKFNSLIDKTEAQMIIKNIDTLVWDSFTTVESKKPILDNLYKLINGLLNLSAIKISDTVKNNDELESGILEFANKIKETLNEEFNNKEISSKTQMINLISELVSKVEDAATVSENELFIEYKDNLNLSIETSILSFKKNVDKLFDSNKNVVKQTIENVKKSLVILNIKLQNIEKASQLAYLDKVLKSPKEDPLYNFFLVDITNEKLRKHLVELVETTFKAHDDVLKSPDPSSDIINKHAQVQKYIEVDKELVEVIFYLIKSKEITITDLKDSEYEDLRNTLVEKIEFVLKQTINKDDLNRDKCKKASDLLKSYSRLIHLIKKVF